MIAVACGGAGVALAARARPGIEASRRLVEEALAAGRPVYGINTGFGQLVDVAIAPAEVEQLQVNLLRSHAAGVGAPLEREAVRAMILLRANSLAGGCSGVRPELIELLTAMLNAGVHPIVPSQGSVGASGDLAPLAHIALVLIGEGQAEHGGEQMDGATALARADLGPLKLAAKEGLALINGTQLMTGLGALCLRDARTLITAAEVAAALSVDVLMGTGAAYHPLIQEARGQRGQIESARRLRGLLAGSAIAAAHRDSDHKVQDAYTLRCVPQVVGAVRDAVDYSADVIERELNAVTDNPLVFAAEELIVSGGNFHGQPLSLALDVLAIALAQLGNFSERRSYRLLSPQDSGLPAFLTAQPGLNSGLMIAQYSAAALAAENKGLAQPASVDSIPTSAGSEDFNSMGAGAALKARRVVANCSRIIAIELICAAQALEFRRPLRTSRALEEAHVRVRQSVAALAGDRPLGAEIEALAAALLGGALDGLEEE